MSRYATSLLMLAAALGFSTVSSAVEVRPATESPHPTVAITASKASFASDEDVKLDLKLSNEGRSPIFVQVPYQNGHLCRVIIQDLESGKEVVVKHPPGPWDQVYYLPVRIDPTFFYGSNINLGKLRPGKYTLRVRYDSHPATAQRGVWTGTMLSNIVKVDVEQPPEDEVATQPFGPTERMSVSRLDSTGDGRVDTVAQYLGTQLFYLTKDSDADGRPDLWQDYRRAIMVTDSDRDSLPDTWNFFKNGKVFRKGYDTDKDGRPDRFENAEDEE